MSINVNDQMFPPTYILDPRLQDKVSSSNKQPFGGGFSRQQLDTHTDGTVDISRKNTDLDDYVNRRIDETPRISVSVI